MQFLIPDLRGHVCDRQGHGAAPAQTLPALAKCSELGLALPLLTTLLKTPLSTKPTLRRPDCISGLLHSNAS
ncbi:MAG: hypothetical protein WCH44_17825, partial [Betaproteobacteria bacterium]